MSIEPELPPKRINLAILATIFAITFCVAFGLCTVSAISGGFGSARAENLMVQGSIAAEVSCALGLLIVGLMAIVRAMNK